MGNINKVAKNYLFNLAYNIFALIIPLITTPYISRVLSVESIGTYSYTHSIILYFTAFVALGTKSYAIKKVSRSADKAEQSKVFWDVFSLRFLIGSAALIVYYVLSFIYIEPIRVAIAQSLYIISVILDISWFYQGLEEFKIIVVRNFLIKIVSCVGIFCFVKDDSDLITYIICLAGMTAVGNLSLWTYLKGRINKFHKIFPFTGIKEIIVLFIPTLALQIYSAVDQTMLGIMSPTMTENGYYEQSLKIISALMTVVSSLSIVLLPKVSNLFGSGKLDEVKEAMKHSYMFIFMISLPMCFGMLSVSDIFVPWFLGEKYVRCIELVNIFSPMFIINGMCDITGFQYLVATDRQRVYALSIVCGTVANIGLNIPFVIWWGATGAVIASVISQVVVIFVQLGYLLLITKEFTVFDIVGGSGKYLLSSVVMYVVIKIIKLILNLNATLELIVLVGIGTIIYLLILLLTKDYFVNIGIVKIKNVLTGKKETAK